MQTLFAKSQAVWPDYHHEVQACMGQTVSNQHLDSGYSIFDSPLRAPGSGIRDSHYSPLWSKVVHHDWIRIFKPEGVYLEHIALKHSINLTALATYSLGLIPACSKWDSSSLLLMLHCVPV